MIFKTNQTSMGIRIPAAALKIGHMEYESELSVHVKNGMLTILPARMTAEMRLQVVRKLDEQQEHLMDYLEKACGPCDECCGNSCPLEDAPSFFVADHLLEAANIPVDATLYAVADAEEGCITIMEAEQESRPMRKMPDDLRLLADRGLCISRVRELMSTGAVIYGDR